MTVTVRTARANWAEAFSARRTTSLIGLVGSKSDDNRRWAHRRSSATAGYIYGGEIVDPVNCVILDTSSTGARIEIRALRGSRFHNINDLPKQFTIVFQIDRVAVDCAIAWRRGSELGIKFTSPARSIPAPKRKLVIKPKK
jgi:hypothetical protein